MAFLPPSQGQLTVWGHRPIRNREVSHSPQCGVPSVGGQVQPFLLDRCITFMAIPFLLAVGASASGGSTGQMPPPSGWVLHWGLLINRDRNL